jgi:predicted esterase
MTLPLGLLLIGILGLSCLSTSIFKQQDQVLAQQYIQTIKHRNLVIDLGNGVKTNAQLTYPAVGKGPFPGVILVHGTGPVDMNESLGITHIDNKTGQKIYPPSQPFFQISQYLSERGFAVLRYDKRGVSDESFTYLDKNVYGNATFNDLKQDATKALVVLIKQPEVDPSKITIIGHSEGAMIAPRIVIENNNATTKIKNIVLMGAVAQNLKELIYSQIVTRPILYAEKALDHNHDGLLSISEASKNPLFSSIAGNVTLALTKNNNATTNKTTSTQQLNPSYNTNKDAYMSINNELKPNQIKQYNSLFVPSKRLDSMWARSIAALEPTLNIIGNVPPTTSILIQQGQNDSQTPIQHAFLLQQELIDKKHPDHILITYPNLGHAFYPSSEYDTSTAGPMPPYVLADLYSWLEAHSGFTHTPTSMPSSYSSSNSTTK